MSTIYQIKNDLVLTGDKLNILSGYISNVSRSISTYNISAITGLDATISQFEDVLETSKEQLETTSKDCENGLEILLADYIKDVKMLTDQTKEMKEKCQYLITDIKVLQQAVAMAGNDYTLFTSPFSIADLKEFADGFEQYKVNVDRIQTLSVYWDSQLVIKQR